MNKPEIYRDYCDICSSNDLNPVMHALLYCNGTSQSREELWEWINDIMPIEMAVHLASLTDMEFLLVILDNRSEVFMCTHGHMAQLLPKFASYVSLCYRSTVLSI